MVECDLAKVEVAGSTPVSRSITLLVVAPRPCEGLCSQGSVRRAPNSRRGTQVVRERSAKPLCVGSIPTRASKIFRYLSQAIRVRSHLTCAWIGLDSRNLPEAPGWGGHKMGAIKGATPSCAMQGVRLCPRYLRTKSGWLFSPTPI